LVNLNHFLVTPLFIDVPVLFILFTPNATFLTGFYYMTGSSLPSTNCEKCADPGDRSLYIQALAALQNMDENDQLSYFQIAGIHGRPYIPWNGVSGVPGSGWGGYCTHGN